MYTGVLSIGVDFNKLGVFQGVTAFRLKHNNDHPLFSVVGTLLHCLLHYTLCVARSLSLSLFIYIYINKKIQDTLFCFTYFYKKNTGADKYKKKLSYTGLQIV